MGKFQIMVEIQLDKFIFLEDSIGLKKGMIFMVDVEYMWIFIKYERCVQEINNFNYY